MPIFYQKDINPHTRLGIWKIEEQELFFLDKVPYPAGVTHSYKRLQHLAGRYLLQYLFPEFPYNEILIADTRKPYLPQEQFHFSISHSGNYAAALVSSRQRTGIDIELYSPKTELVKHKFLTSEELQLLDHQLSSINHPPSTTDYQHFTLCWCCKEAVYKHWGAGGIDFKKHISIQRIDAATQQVDILFSKQYAQLLVQYILLEQLCLAWTISA